MKTTKSEKPAKPSVYESRVGEPRVMPKPSVETKQWSVQDIVLRCPTMRLFEVRYGIATYSLMPHFDFAVFVNLTRRPILLAHELTANFKPEIQEALNKHVTGLVLTNPSAPSTTPGTK